jgi:F-type H+-transporting ATPase subunit b
MMKVIFLTAMAWAQEGAEHAAEAAHGAGEAAAHGGHEGIPWDSIFVQSFNFLVLVALLVFLLRKTVKAHFQHRANDYKQMVERADAAKREAEQGKLAIKSRLDKLESGASEGLNRAKQEAAELRAKLQSEAKELSEKIEVEAKRSAQVELEKAKDELRRELLDSALQASHLTLKTSLNANEQSRLQKEFVEKIQVVGS